MELLDSCNIVTTVSVWQNNAFQSAMQKAYTEPWVQRKFGSAQAFIGLLFCGSGSNCWLYWWLITRRPTRDLLFAWRHTNGKEEYEREI
jgi:hypothetical protein